jgi:hypothetical protein
MSASHRVETSQLQLPGLCVRAQIDGVCGQIPIAEGGHVADPGVDDGNRAEHACRSCMFSSLIVPFGIRICGPVKQAKLGECLDLPDG